MVWARIKLNEVKSGVLQNENCIMAGTQVPTVPTAQTQPPQLRCDHLSLIRQNKMADKQAADAAAKLVEEAPFDASSLPSFVRYLDVQVGPLFDSSAVVQLELKLFDMFLATQIQQGTYDAESNRCILKIFQLHPSQVQLDVVVKVLVKALSNLPLNDFVDFYAVLSEQVVRRKCIFGV